MEPIPEALVDETWQEVARFKPNRASKEMKRTNRSQPELLAFIMEFSEELEQEAKELAVYMFFVVYRMFQKGCGRRINRIRVKDIIACYDYNEDLIEKLDGIHEKFLDRIARVQLSRQPYVLKYITETLIEAPEQEEALALSEEDSGFIFLLLKTVVDVLDRKG